MKTRILLTSLAITAAVSLSARADLFDNFDSYTTKADFDAVWTPSTGTGLGLNTTDFQSSPNSVKNPGTTAQASRRYFTDIGANQIKISYDFYDYDGGNARDFLQVQSRVTADFTSGLNNLLAIGKYNTITGTKYYGRVSTATGAVYGDGAGTPSSTWFLLTGAGDRAVGWHNATVIGENSSAYSGKVKYSFYIDGVLGGTVDNLTAYNYNWAVLGSGLSTAPSGLAFDNLRIAVVPEPSSLALCLLGGLAVTAGRILRRRG